MTSRTSCNKNKNHVKALEKSRREITPANAKHLKLAGVAGSFKRRKPVLARYLDWHEPWALNSLLVKAMTA